jgi:hypothetical protein
MAEPAAEPRKRMLERVRDYAVDQPSFTTAFAAWELEVSPSAVNLAVKQLLKLEIITEIEPRSGPYAAVYAYNATPRNERRVRLFTELDASGAERVAADLAAKRGEVVPHTRAKGSSGKPGLDHKRQENGIRVKRGRSTGYGGR